MKSLATLLLLCSFAMTSAGQETVPVNGVRDVRDGSYAFTGATIHTDYDTVVQNATLLISNGKVVSVARNGSVPDGYVEVPSTGKHIYPSFIDAYSTYGVPEAKRAPAERFSGEQITSNTDGPYNANEAIKAEYDAYAHFKVNDKEAGSLRSQGFGTVNTFRADGLARGTSTIVTLTDDSENNVILKDRGAAMFSFDKGTSRQSYPSSAMGYISLLRQTYLDAGWYDSASPKPFLDKTLEAWIASSSLPQIFGTNGWLSILRADKLGDEFGVQYIIKGGGNEYQRLEAVRSTGASLIVPVNFPDAVDVTDPIDAYQVSLQEMKHWELAPGNPAAIANAGISFAVTSSDLKDAKSFLPNLRKAIERGLSEQDALRALTTTPATLLGVDNLVGSLETGKLANFLITSEDIFDADNVIYENWIQGRRHVVNDPDVANLAGTYTLSVDGTDFDLEITGDPGKHAAKIIIDDSTSSKATFKHDGQSVTLAFDPDPSDSNDGQIRLAGWLKDSDLAGSGQLVNGDWITWSAVHTGSSDQDDDTDRSDADSNDERLGPVIYPFVAYGQPSVPEAETILIRNATVWTMEDDTRILENTDVLLRDGKIAEIGEGLSSRRARVIDGTGKHVTPGIIDEHSHLAASSINDVATNSGMVRIGDVINSEDLGIYRALSGGVTALQILHGSANPIGGQSALIKLRWGALPEEMKIEDADGFIKFALGENVKRSRSVSSIRYPQTRMGVEQVYVDAFTSARDYERKHNAYNALSDTEKASTLAPRRDLLMDTMLEILNGERFVTSHSYVQSEINMLMKVAERFDFRINTFTHILEGYKVADKMAAHGVGGSTFADWWAYKWEVRYAIPYNATIMSREGVVTAINSDDGEMIRRLNQEAAKSVKYGGLSEYDAFKMVTINPATLLHLDDRMGSIKEGKDADVVIWSDNPLSIYAKAEQTIVDGVVRFDLDRDRELRESVAKERARLVEKMRDAKANGASTQRSRPSFKHTWECEDVVIYREN